MSFDPFETESHLNEDVGMFEAAAHAQPVELQFPELNNLQVTLDGSNQDATTREIARGLAETAGAKLHEQQGAASAAEILEQARRNRAELLVIPVPFGSDFQLLRDESLGSVVDMVLLEAPCPVLCVREPMSAEQVRAALAHVLIPIAVGGDLVKRAVSWAFRLAPSGGTIELWAVADRDVLDEARHLLPGLGAGDAFDPDKVLRALMDEIGGLVASAHKLGVQQGDHVHVESKVGRFVPLVCDHANAQPQLIVWAAEKDHTSPTFHRAADLVLSSRGPVLIA